MLKHFHIIGRSLKTNLFTIRNLNLRSLYCCFPFVFVALGCSSFLIRNNQFKKIVQSLYRRLHNDKVNPRIINNVEECVSAVTELRKRCSNVRVLGMDCEWLAENKTTTRVALLQLASVDGSCSLFRLCNIGHVPVCLNELLSDESIIKTGVAVINDARRLFKDYGVSCKRCIDVRYLAKQVGLTALGLGRMSELYLGVELDKSWKIRCSDWEAEVLSDRQIQYAAKDALMSVYLFSYFNDVYISKTYPWWKRIFWTDKYFWQRTEECWIKYSDLGFSEKSFSWHQQKGKNYKYGEGYGSSSDISDFGSIQKRVSSTPPKDNFRQFSTRTSIARKSPFYHNIFVQAPDGTVLCTCDNKKADWYLKKGIACIVCEDPLTVRLNFEPSGRKGGGEGYYASVKKNICVVCGSTKSMRRKNIVPHEYRKYFPVELKEHSSHDVLLFCDYCHFQSQFFDQQLRNSLAEECDAPFGNEGNSKVLEVPVMRQIKSAARALLHNRDKIPELRKKELESLLLNYLKNNNHCIFNSSGLVMKDINTPEILNKDLLKRLSYIETCVENDKYQPHGMKVVEYYKKKGENGIYLLEQLWRKHFIKNMAPKFLPDLWSINYTHGPDRK